MKPDILMIFPRLGSEDVFVKDMPLGLLYASSDVVRKGYRVKTLDLRLHKDWRSVLYEHLDMKPRIIGLSVYTGNPIKVSLEISKAAKERTDAVVVWGGPHASLDPDLTMASPYVDYLVRGYGSEAFGRLTDNVFGKDQELETIQGISYRHNGKVYHNPVSDALEFIDYRDIPYHLIEKDIDAYSRFNSDERLIPIYTSMGCPYRCAFCVSPILYKMKKVKWKAYSNEDIIAHIKYLKEKYGANHISVYDDDAFVDLARIKILLKAIKENGLGIRISFRGARINELDRIDDETLGLLEETGSTHFQVGVESGSDKVLKVMNKNITVEQILRVNNKLSRFKKLVPIYNLMSGIPGENVEDLKMTADIMIRLLKDNPSCIIGHPVKFKPYPGSELFDRAIAMGLKRPERLEEWIRFDSGEADVYFDWYTPEYNHFIKMMQVTSYFVDSKITREIRGPGLFNRTIRLISRIYHPVAYWRLKHKCDRFLIEDKALALFRRLMRGHDEL